MLLLRWMARPADGVDLGLWPIPTEVLLIPVDTHIHKLGKNLGLTRRNDVSWKTAEEITAALRRFDAADPVKYDFSLCHLGMLQRCPSRRDPARCEGCGVKSVCRHWARWLKRARFAIRILAKLHERPGEPLLNLGNSTGITLARRLLDGARTPRGDLLPRGPCGVFSCPRARPQDRGDRRPA